MLPTLTFAVAWKSHAKGRSPSGLPAIDQLGHAHLDVRLGGIYAIERIARDSPADRAAIGEVLTAFIRSHAPWPPSLPGQYLETAPIDCGGWHRPFHLSAA